MQETHAELTDGTVSLSPYFEIVPGQEEAFKAVWKQAFEPFAHKDDCVHYAFTFDGVFAHCREAYKDAAGVLQHLGDVDAPLKQVLDPSIAKLLRLECHGPADELAKLREPLGAFGCKFFVAEWGFRPTRPAQAKDAVVHLYPYFELLKPAAFKQTWLAAYAATEADADAEKSAMYAFAFEDDKTALCREAYGDAEGVLLHLKNVDGPLNAVLAPGPDGVPMAKLQSLEVHGPAGELSKLQEALAPLGAKFFNLEWGFRNATGSSKVCSCLPSTVCPQLLSALNCLPSTVMPSTVCPKLILRWCRPRLWQPSSKLWLTR